MAGIFKAYDIRGIYGDTLTEPMAAGIGRAYATFTGARRVVVGRDMRTHSAPMFDALAAGLMRQGVEVIDVGMCSTPMCYFACGSLKADGAVMITASHNPGEWNGFKLTRENAIPISGATGIQDIERIYKENAFAAPAATPGRVVRQDVAAAYRRHVLAIADIKRPVRIAADMANAMGVKEADALAGALTIDRMFGDLDGSFPNHEANPLKAETLEALQAKIRSGRYDFGAAFDGDADRVGFVDETGAVIAMDIAGALIAQDLLHREKGVIFYDLRSSWAVKETIEAAGGTPMMSRVGHAFIKQQMRDHNAIYAGEFSGHYYFRRNFFTESSAMAVLCMANIVSASKVPLSELIRPIRRYAQSGEINSTVADPNAVMAAIRARYADGKRLDLDGISVEYDDWWFNVRASNTEPLVRLNVEAKDPSRMEQKRDELLRLIRQN
jgi:phosphomannomutase